MYQYYNKLYKYIDLLEKDVPDILKDAYEDTMGVFLNRFLRRIKIWKTSIFTGLVISFITAAIGLPFIIVGIVLAFTTPLLLLSIILGGIGLGFGAIGLGIFLITNNLIAYYNLGKNIGRLEERSKEMLHKFPEYKTKVHEIVNSSESFTPKTQNITTEACKSFKGKNLESQQVNMFLLTASTIFNNTSNTSSLDYSNGPGQETEDSSSNSLDTPKKVFNKPIYCPKNTGTPPDMTIIPYTSDLKEENSSNDSNNSTSLEQLLK